MIACGLSDPQAMLAQTGNYRSRAYTSMKNTNLQGARDHQGNISSTGGDAGVGAAVRDGAGHLQGRRGIR